MNNLQLDIKIKKIAKEKGITIKDLCQKIGMTENGFAKTLKNNTIKVETLIKIGDVLDIDISYFFLNENSISDSHNYKSISDKIAVIQKDNDILEAKNIIYEQFVENFVNQREDLLKTVSIHKKEIFEIKNLSKLHYDIVMRIIKVAGIYFLKNNEITDLFIRKSKKVQLITNKLNRPIIAVDIS